jgi:hypothetical protein
LPIDHQIASTLIDERLKSLRQRAYEELVALIGRPDTTSALGQDGRAYQLETQVFWDSRKGGDIRVMVSANDGRLRSLMRLTADFIMAPDGSFVGESFGGY